MENYFGALFLWFTGLMDNETAAWRGHRSKIKLPLKIRF
jgi:hypothetical protein